MSTRTLVRRLEQLESVLADQRSAHGKSESSLLQRVRLFDGGRSPRRSLNFSPALKVLSNTAPVSKLRTFRRTRVWPPRAVGVH